MRDTDNSAAIAPSLLTWYDAHARDLPWRIGPEARRLGALPDPYRVWLSEIMLQQTTVAAVRAYFLRFTALWPTVHDLAGAEDAAVMAEWAGLGYYARARNLLKCARVLRDEHGGVFPRSEAALQRLPGIGPYTAAAIAAIAFDQPAAVMDGNVERVMARIFSVRAPLPGCKPVLKAHTARCTPVARPGCYAQSVMDLGATVCTPKSPACGICPLRPFCAAHREGIAPELPAKSPRKAKPTRVGIAYLARRSDGAMLLETRPDRGLLGGMLGWPGTNWAEQMTDLGDAAPIDADWHDRGLEVRHTFTHFHLRLSLRLAVVGVEVQPIRGEFHAPAAFRPRSLPTVMRKAYDMTHGVWPEIGAILADLPHNNPLRRDFETDV